ncbi:MAG: tail completion protein gp17, partial [Bryobacteraceae bacterium]
VKSGGGRPRFQLDCWSKADIGVWALRDAVRLELKGFHGLLGGSGGVAVSDITLENSRDMFERDTGIYHVPMDFFIFHAEADCVLNSDLSTAGCT